MSMIKVCDTPGCRENENTSTMTALQEGDFCEACMAGQQFTNEATLAYRELPPDMEWAEMQSDRYDVWANEY